MARWHDHSVSIHVPGASLSQIKGFAFGQISMMLLILCLYCMSHLPHHLFQYWHSSLSLQDPHATSNLWLWFQLISSTSESDLRIWSYFHTLYLYPNTRVWHENWGALWHGNPAVSRLLPWRKGHPLRVHMRASTSNTAMCRRQMCGSSMATMLLGCYDRLRPDRDCLLFLPHRHRALG